MRWQYRDPALVWLLPLASAVHIVEEWIAGVPAWIAVVIGAPLPRSQAAPGVFRGGVTIGVALHAAVFVIASAAFGLVTLALVWTRRFPLARWTAAGAVACIVIGWAFAQSPYLLPGELTLDEAAAPDATLTALLISVGVGVVTVAPIAGTGAHGTSGGLSSSMIVTWPCASAIGAPTAFESVTVNVSCGSSSASPRMGTAMTASRCPGANVSVPLVAV